MSTDAIGDHLVGSPGLDVCGQGDVAFRCMLRYFFNHLDRFVTERITNWWKSRPPSITESTRTGPQLFGNRCSMVGHGRGSGFPFVRTRIVS